MKTLTKEEALALVKWYETVGVLNWGVWSDYPRLTVGASYHSFDTCHCRIKFDEDIMIDGDEYQGIADSRFVPGNGNYYHIEYLKELFLDGYKTAKEEARTNEENSCFQNFDFLKFAQIIKDYPVSGNKHERRSFERQALHSCGFVKSENVSQSWGYYLAMDKIK
jgi:hypothetical protein